VLSNEEAYSRTEVGVVEVKTVPPTVALQAAGRGEYFATNDSVFGSLFSYISRNDVKMTVPVEADVVDANRMRFFVGSADRAKVLPSGAGVSVLALPERKVVAVGLRGSYSRERFDEGRSALDAWLVAHPEWRAAGTPYAVYWNGPFVPAFVKRSEAHLPIEAAAP
jgi:hypothetical protein